MNLDPRNIEAYISICIGPESTDIRGTEIKIFENLLKIFSLSMMTKVQIKKISHYRSSKRISLRFFGIPGWYGRLGNTLIIRYLILSMKCTHKLNSGFLTVGIISCQPHNGSLTETRRINIFSNFWEYVIKLTSRQCIISVSYTHLTLPTIYSV